jgi:RNA-binding protein 26
MRLHPCRYYNTISFLIQLFTCISLNRSCDADPVVLAQYIVALIGNEQLNADLKASLEEKLHEFFDDRKFFFCSSLVFFFTHVLSYFNV